MAEGGTAAAAPIRRVAVFHNLAQVGSAWCCAEGLVTTLATAGYEVFNCGHPRTSGASLDLLRTMDLIILGAPEWYDEDLAGRYGTEWLRLPAVKAIWYAESAYRDDRNFDFGRCRVLADLHYFPAVQDAEQFGGVWLPFAADTTLFRPMPVARAHATAFLGTIYPKRQQYIRDVGFPITILPPVHADNPVASFHLLAQAYSSTQIFVNMPAYSRLLVTKVTEVMACRTMLVTPSLDHPSGLGNMLQFESGRHLVYYDQQRPQELAAVLAYYLAHPAEREAIAEAGYREVVSRHSLKARVDRMLADAEALRTARVAGRASVAQIPTNAAAAAALRPAIAAAAALNP